MKTKLHQAQKTIEDYFSGRAARVYRLADLEQHLENNRETWHLPPSMSKRTFVRFLLEKEILSESLFAFPAPYKREVRYVRGGTSIYEVALALKPQSYFSHYTAVSFHGLTEQVPKTIYLNAEQVNAGQSTSPLTQASIDRAFKLRVRTTANVADAGGFRVCIVSGKNSGNLGVLEKALIPDAGPLRYTCIERTLIDVCVRPVYSGGVFEVRKAFELARGRASVEQMASLLEKLKYTYPYHQAIGYYLQRAGYPEGAVGLFRKMPMQFDFYLTHQMSQTDFVNEWRLYVPKGF